LRSPVRSKPQREYSRAACSLPLFTPSSIRAKFFLVRVRQRRFETRHECVRASRNASSRNSRS